MKFTESDLVLLSCDSGWTGNRAQLSEHDLERLIAQVKPPILPEKQDYFGQGLNKIFGDLVARVRYLQELDPDGGSGVPGAPRSAAEDNSRPTKRSTQVKEELSSISEAIQNLSKVLEETSLLTSQVINEYIDERSLSAGANIADIPTYAKLQDQAFDSLLLILGAANQVEIQVKPGRDEACLKHMVRQLARLYEVSTGKAPGRVYRPIAVTDSKMGGEEGGDFLALVRELAQLAHIKLRSEGGYLGSTSPSKIVREVLEARRS